MIVPNGIDSNVEREPTMAAPIPAICPRGSMAKEFMLPNKIPMQKKVNMRYAIKNHKGV